MTMATHILPQPGLIWGLYPEKRSERNPPVWRKAAQALQARWPASGLSRYRQLAEQSLTRQSELTTLSASVLDDAVRTLKQQLLREGLTVAARIEAFALIGEACRRQLGLSPFVTQRMAAAIMLDNQLAEMATGEGKTLVAALTAAAGALAGIPVHVVTANDYLVGRDADKLRPLYAALGLTVGAIQPGQDNAARRAAYDCDIVYCTAKELVFDYLRDLPQRSLHRTELAWHAAHFAHADTRPPTLLRGLCMAVIDEADGILIDEARVPLIISELQDNAGQREAHRDILALAAKLHPNRDFTIVAHSQSAQLTEPGLATLDAATANLHPVWHNRRHRDEMLCLALAALHLFQRDRHYLVRDDGVHIIDETTGRLAPGRTWSRGLHQLIELKENWPLSGEAVTRAQITYQRFFPRYFRLCGMSGTLTESRSELRRVYQLKVVPVPLRKPSQRIDLGQRVFMQRKQQWHAVVERLRALSSSGRPVLIGTDSVADSDSLAAYLAQHGITHTVLNARHDQHEADIVALAGHTGKITVATNMAGRGTDIPLAHGVNERGGLHVISCQMNSARRIDRQLKGRCARQGNAGSVETLLCLESALMQRSLPAMLLRLAARLAHPDSGQLPGWLGKLLAFWTQRREESHQAMQRDLLLYQDQQRDRQAAFRD